MVTELTGSVVAEKYRVESLMRTSDLGGFYRGRHLFMDKPVMLKVMNPALAVDRQLREHFASDARTIASISHPNLLSVSDIGSQDEESYYVGQLGDVKAIFSRK